MRQNEGRSWTFTSRSMEALYECAREREARRHIIAVYEEGYTRIDDTE